MKLVQTEKTSIWNAVGGPSCVAKDAGCIQSAIALADQRQGNGHRKRVGAKGGRDRAHGGSIDVNDVDVSISTVVGRQVYVEIHPQVRTIRTLSSDVRGDACALVLVRVKVNESKHGIELGSLIVPLKTKVSVRLVPSISAAASVTSRRGATPNVSPNVGCSRARNHLIVLLHQNAPAKVRRAFTAVRRRK